MKSSFPNSSQFSPTQTPLPDLLRIVRETQPSRQAMQNAIGTRFFATSADPVLARNTIFALSEYQILDKPVENISVAKLTEFGESLAQKAADGQFDEMYKDLARHILLNLRGLELVQCVDDLVARGSKITKSRIARELAYRGLHIPPNGTHLNGMRQWFEMAGLVEEGKWVANKEILKQLLGDIDEPTLVQFAELTREQKAFAIAFARMNVEVAQSNRVADFATSLFGVEFPEGGLPQSTLFALRDAGLITCEKTTSGQGAKPYLVRPTDRLKSDFIEPIFNAIENSVGVKYRKLIRMTFEEILLGLESESKHTKGLALEALAFYIGRLLGLSFVQWRMRTAETGGAELDVIMESADLVFSRWQIQCKNSSQATLEDIAKEVGLAEIIKTNVIVIITTGRIGDKAKQFAERVMRETNFQVILLHRKHLLAIKNDPSIITEFLRSQSEVAMTLKRNQIGII